MPINIQGPQPIVIEEPGALFEGLGATFLKGVISDAFYQMRHERVKEAATLWDAYKLDAEVAMKLTNPDQVEDAINRLDLAIANPETSPNVIGSLQSAKGALKNHQTRLYQDMPASEIQDVTEGFKQTYNEAVIRNAVNPAFLDEVIKDYEDEEARLIEKFIPERMGDVDEARASLDAFMENERAEFASKYYKEGTTEIREDLTVEELQSLVQESQDLSTKSTTLREDLDIALEMAENDPVAYLRDVKNDRLASKSLDIMQNQIRLLRQEYDKAQSLKTWNVAVNDFEKLLNDARLNPDDYGELSRKILEEMTDIAEANSHYLTKTNLDVLDEMHMEAQSITGALNVINRVKAIQETGGYESDDANEFVQSAFQEATRGYLTEDSKAVSNAISNLNSAISKEASFHRNRAQNIRIDKAADTKGFKGRLTPIVTAIGESFGAGAKSAEAKQKYASDYLEKGKFELNESPKAMFEGFNLNDRRNVIAYKVQAGQDLAKLVKSSKLASENSQVNKLANTALNVNKDMAKRAQALDELFIKHLKNKDKDLDFIGWGAKDTATKELYSQWLEIYGILHEAEVESVGKWGEDFSQSYVSEYGHGTAIDPLTGEPIIILSK